MKDGVKVKHVPGKTVTPDLSIHEFGHVCQVVFPFFFGLFLF